MSRKTISVTADAYDALAEHKREDESWSECFHRLANHLGDTEHGPNTVVVENVDEIGRIAADHVEERMTRR